MPLMSLLLSAALAAPHGAAVEPADWPAAGAELAVLLSDYLRVDTTNPPGAELAGAQFLAARLHEEGIDSQVMEYAPGRANLVARLSSAAPQAPPICLLSHIDVASAEAELWPEGKGPLSGTIDGDGVVWGRGALDMKGLGAMQLMAMVWLKRLELPLTRDVVLLAVADEEVNNLGVQELIANHWQDIGCSHVLNEGGLGLSDLFFDGQDLLGISVGEKGAVWLRLVAEGTPGHGSTPRPDEAPDRLVAALGRLAAHEPDPRIDPVIWELLDRVGQDRSGLERAVFTRPALVRGVLQGKLMANPLTRAVITDTIHLTGIEGAAEPNVVPSQLYAQLDCRTLPGTTTQDVLDTVNRVVNDPKVRIEVLFDHPAGVSPWREDPFFDALQSSAQLEWPEAVVTPALSVGFTDSIYLREQGVTAYGFMPVLITADQAGTMHGNGEHVSTDNLERGLRVLLRTLVQVAT